MSAGPNQIQVAEALKRAQEIAAKMAAPSGAAANGEDYSSRKRPLDEAEDGPQVKKPTVDAPAGGNPQAIAQAAIAKLAPVVGAQLGINQMLTVDIKIPNRMVGLVIGRGGEMINKLQSESAARIQVAPDGSEINGERGVTICGTPETIERAKELVKRVVEEAGGATTMMVSGAITTMNNVEPGQQVMEIMIPSGKVGLIIGKGGETIKMLQDKAGCKMQMIQDGPYANAPEKPLRMSGLPECCERAKRLVVELMDQKEMEARGITATASGGCILEVKVPKTLVGFVIGRNGEHINNIQNTCGVRLQFQSDIPGMGYRVATITGPQIGDNCQRAQRMIDDIVRERQMVEGGGGGGGGVGVGGGGAGFVASVGAGMSGGFRQHVELPNPTGPGVQTIQFPVPSNKCGLIIGKGGDTIRQLQVASRCQIELYRGEHPNPSEKLFNIKGLPQDIQTAQSLIRQKYEMPVGGESFPSQMPGMAYPGGVYQQSANPYSAQQGWAQYPFPQGYAAGTPQVQQQGAAADPNHQAAWTAYYQQLYAAQAAQAGQQPAAPGGQPSAGPPAAGAQGVDVNAQWAEYYRQLGQAYMGGQQGAPQPGQQQLPPEHKCDN